MLLSLPAGRTHLGKWPQYAGRIVVDASGRCQLHLNVLCYFLFWLAFAVLKGGDSAAAADKRRTAFDPAGITQFARKVLGVVVRSLIACDHTPVHRQALQWGHGDDVGGHPTLRLLRTYLDTFLPQSSQGPKVVFLWWYSYTTMIIPRHPGDAWQPRHPSSRPRQGLVAVEHFL